MAKGTMEQKKQCADCKHFALNGNPQRNWSFTCERHIRNDGHMGRMDVSPFYLPSIWCVCKDFERVEPKQDSPVMMIVWDDKEE